MSDLASATLAGAGSPPAGPTTEAFAVRIGYIWLMALAPVAGLVICLLSVFAEGSMRGFLLGLALLAVGYWAWRRGYQAVRLVLAPEHLRVLPVVPGQPAQAVALSSIASYLLPQQSYYQILYLFLHGGVELNFSRRLRTPPAGLLAFDDWAQQLASRLEQARSAITAGAPAPASGLLAAAPRVFARTVLGKILAGLAVVGLLLGGLALLGGAHVAGALFIAPGMYLGYYFRARGALKVTTSSSTRPGGARRPDALDREMDEQRTQIFDELNRFSD